MIREDSKQILLSVFGIALLIVAVVGISYAVFLFTSKSNVKNTIRSGGVTFQYIESDSVIQIEDALPVSDDVGKKQTKSFDFHVSSNIRGNADINYEVRAKALPVSNPIDYKYVKLYLEKKENGIYKSVLSPSNFKINSNTSVPNSNVDLNTMLLYSGKFSGVKGKTLTYDDVFKLRMWLDSNYKVDQVSRNFKVKISVYASM